MDIHEVEAAAKALDLEATTFPIMKAADIVPAFEAFRGHADALYVVADPLTSGAAFGLRFWQSADACQQCTVSVSSSKPAG